MEKKRGEVVAKVTVDEAEIMKQCGYARIGVLTLLTTVEKEQCDIWKRLRKKYKLVDAQKYNVDCEKRVIRKVF